MNLFASSGLLIFFSSLTFGLFSWAKGNRFLNKVWALFNFAVAIWGIGAFKFSSTKDVKEVFFWLHLGHIGVIFIPVLFLHFVFELLEVKRKKQLIIFYSLTALFFVFNLTDWLGITKLFIVHVRYVFNSFYVDSPPGLFYPFFVAFFFYAVIYGHLCAMKYLKTSIGQKRLQVEYFLFATVLGFSGGGTAFPMVFGLDLYPYLHFAVPLYPLIMTYAIVRYRLMDITLAVTRTGIFVVVYTLILGLPFVFATVMRQWLIDILGTRWWMFPLGLMGALATVGPFIYIYIERKAEDRLLREQRRYQQTLKQASVGMTRIRNLQKLLELITHIVTKTVKISYVAIYLYNPDSSEYVLQVHRDKGRIPVSKVSPDNPLVKWIIRTREPLIYEEVKRMTEDSSDELHKMLEENMRMLTASVVIPSFLEDRSIGFIVLGDKVSGHIYSMDDLNVFQVLASQAALAIENAQFYEEAKEMQEQIAQAEKMATIGTMADGLSHQINNRFNALSLIAGDSIDTIKMTDTSKCTPEVKEMLDQINHALDRIQTNVIQGGEVVRGLLRYSRKEDVGFEALDLNSVINNTLDMVRYKIKLSEFDLVRNFHDENIKIKGNMVHLQEAFFNFIDNAYDAIMERRNTLKEEGFRGRVVISSEAAGEYLKITILDNGMGVKDGHMQKIFTPFFTTKTSSRKGTGLGLYVIKRIITDTHRGKLAFESEYKVGTKFTLELPIAQ